MDFLDPRKRRAYNIRLVIGYVLIALVIGLATVIIVYGANGYGINTKTGQIVQNGLLFADSDPGGAEIYLNGTDKNTKTSARLILPAGNYTLTLKKDGYHDWSRKFTLNEQSVARYVYPLLVPVKPVITNLKSYGEAPGLITQSPNQQWLLVENDQVSANAPIFDQYDTTTLDQTTPDVKQVAFPAGLLTNFSADSKLTEVEWSTDNNNVLLRHDFSGGSEFVIFNRSRPEQSFNVNKLFNTAPSQVNLFNKKADQIYLFSQADGSLRLGTVNDQSLDQPLLKNLLAFKPYGKDLITYVTANNEPKGMVAARIWNNGLTYKFDEFSAGSAYLVDAAQFNGDFYYAAGSDTADRVNIYKNPLDSIKNPAVGRALPLLSLRDPGAQKIGFSNNARFVGLENNQRFAIYDIETGDSYQYPISQALADNMTWMDGHRFIGDTNGQILIMDYDGTNQHVFVATSFTKGALFSANYRHLLTIAPSADGGATLLQDVDMRAGADLPKNKQAASS
jgi:hypothetical protein